MNGLLTPRSQDQKEVVHNLMPQSQWNFTPGSAGRYRCQYQAPPKQCNEILLFTCRPFFSFYCLAQLWSKMM